MKYRVQRFVPDPVQLDNFASPLWQAIPSLEISHFHASGSAHRPLTRAKLAMAGRTLYLIFSVSDQYVRSVQTRYQSMVCTDSCVEFFVQPRPDKGYFNFECNAGGTLHASYVEPAPPPASGIGQITLLPPEFGQAIRVHSSLPAVVDPELKDTIAWWLRVEIPLHVMERYIGFLGDGPFSTWRANFYKCGDHTSHPHWGSWNPIGSALNFHNPRYFGELLMSDGDEG